MRVTRPQLDERSDECKEMTTSGAAKLSHELVSLKDILKAARDIIHSKHNLMQSMSVCTIGFSVAIILANTMYWLAFLFIDIELISICHLVAK